MLVSLGAGCTADANRPDAAGAAEAPAVQIGPENIVTVTRDRIVTGPIVSGELRAAREATVRAEIGGPIEEVRVEEGQSVRRGALLGRIEVSSLDDSRRAARSTVRSAENQLDVARREAARTSELVEAGALAVRDLDLARASVAAAEAQLAEAQARLVGVETQIGNALIHAPIAGIVSSRPVNLGDVVSPGTALVTIIDPSSMRLDASVPSHALASVRVGATVRFEVGGYDRPFEGRIERINPRADPITRQVPIYVAIPNVGGRLVAGLFAEGRLVDQSEEGLVVPSNAVNTSGTSPWVLRVRDGRTEKVDVTLGVRDERTERLLVTAGVAEGDILLRGPAQGITPGTPVRVSERPPSATTTNGPSS
jgi:RND family efflux transporter MFP subunit